MNVLNHASKMNVVAALACISVVLKIGTVKSASDSILNQRPRGGGGLLLTP